MGGFRDDLETTIVDILACGKMTFIQIYDLLFIKIDRNECYKQLVNYL